MKSVLAATGFALGLLAGAVAANAADTTTSTTSKTPAYAAPATANADDMKAADEIQHTNIRKQLEDQLDKAGYTDVKIIPSSFFIRAKDKKGEAVAMVVGPDSFVEVTDMTAKSSGATAQSGSNPTTQQK